MANITVTGWAAGGLLGAGEAYLLRNVSSAGLGIVPTLPILVSLLVYAWICPESPQVMVMQWPYDQTTQGMLRIARINKRVAEYSMIPAFQHESVFSRV